MTINNINEKAWKLLEEELEGNKVFKYWDNVPNKMKKTYIEKYENIVYYDPKMISIELSQPQHSDWGKIILYMYNLDNIVEARSGYRSNGMWNTLTVKDTKENLLSWLDIVNEEVGEKANEFIEVIKESLNNMDSDKKRVKIPTQSQMEQMAS